jgi:hypothetical protein
MLKLILAPFAVLAVLGSYALSLWQPAQPSLGVALPSATAVFETSLQDRISPTDTSLSIVSASTRGGGTLSGYQCFTIDEGRSDAEYVCGTLSGTTLSSLERGLDPLTGTSSVTALQFAHRKGANVKITDFPLVERLRNQAAGVETYPSALSYADGVTPTAGSHLTDKEYVDALAFSGAGIIDASSLAKGVVELATGIEAASSTVSGSSGTLSLPASIATSSYNAATAALRVIVTGNAGKIDDNFLATSTLFATSSISASPIGNVGKNMQVFTSTGTSTFSVPSSVSRFSVEVQGSGGGGGGCSVAVSAGAGGGGGGWSYENLTLAGTTTVQVFVGAGGAAATAGTWSTFGTNGFYLSASGGGAGSNGSSGGVATQGATGGLGAGGDINTQGGSGANGSGDSAEASSAFGGNGGSSHYGGGAAGAVGTNLGGAAGNYGGGGGGAACGTGGARSGGAGAQGIVIVRW